MTNNRMKEVDFSTYTRFAPLTIHLSGNLIKRLKFSKVKQDTKPEWELYVYRNPLQTVTNLPIGSQAFTIHTDNSYFCCYFNNTDCNGNDDRSCSFAKRMAMSLISYSLTVGPITLLSNIIVIFHGRLLPTHVVIPMLNINIQGIMIVVHLIMVGITDPVYYIGSLNLVKGPKHIWCLMAALLQFIGIAAMLPTAAIHIYGMYRSASGWTLSSPKVTRGWIIAVWFLVICLGLVPMLVVLSSKHEPVITNHCSYYTSTSPAAMVSIANLLALTVLSTLFIQINLIRVYKIVRKSGADLQQISSFHLISQAGRSFKVNFIKFGLFYCLGSIPNLVSSMYILSAFTTGETPGVTFTLFTEYITPLVALIDPLWYLVMKCRENVAKHAICVVHSTSDTGQ